VPLQEVIFVGQALACDFLAHFFSERISMAAGVDLPHRRSTNQ
jgi:hypothetical protein